MARTNPLAARLRETIIIQSATDSIDAAGGPIKIWSNFITRKASIVPLNGTEYFTAQQLNVDINVRIRLRFDSLASKINPKHRVLWGIRVYDILTVINRMERNEEIILMCQENP